MLKAKTAAFETDSNYKLNGHFSKVNSDIQELKMFGEVQVLLSIQKTVVK